MTLLQILCIALFLSFNAACHAHPLLHSHTVAFVNRRRPVKQSDVQIHSKTIVPRGGDSPDKDNTTTTQDSMEEITNLSNRLKIEEIQKVKKAQEFLKKQERRRQMDKTWLDRGITATIEFFENIFRWEVIDVKD